MNSPVTVTVLKDNYASRSFQFPLEWFTRLGLLLGGAAFLTAVSSGAAIYWFFKAQQASPSKVQELEQQLHETRNRLAQLETAPPKAAPEAEVKTPTLAQTQPQPEPVTASGPKAEEPLGPILLPPTAEWTSLAQILPPATLKRPMPPAETLSFKLAPLQLSWKGRTLQVRSSIQYTAEDGGNQQGRIIILARGINANLAYPKGAIQPGKAGGQLNLEKGEFFSVSRLRPIQADFGPLETNGRITEITILILGSENEILYRQDSPVQAEALP